METIVLFAIAIVALLALGTTMVYLMYLVVPQDFKDKHNALFQDAEARAAHRHRHCQTCRH